MEKQKHVRHKHERLWSHEQKVLIQMLVIAPPQGDSVNIEHPQDVKKKKISNEKLSQGCV